MAEEVGGKPDAIIGVKERKTKKKKKQRKKIPCSALMQKALVDNLHPLTPLFYVFDGTELQSRAEQMLDEKKTT